MDKFDAKFQVLSTPIKRLSLPSINSRVLIRYVANHCFLENTVVPVDHRRIFFSKKAYAEYIHTIKHA